MNPYRLRVGIDTSLVLLQYRVRKGDVGSCAPRFNAGTSHALSGARASPETANATFPTPACLPHRKLLLVHLLIEIYGYSNQSMSSMDPSGATVTRQTTPRAGTAPTATALQSCSLLHPALNPQPVASRMKSPVQTGQGLLESK
jgi:hypothetical protein